VAKNDAQGSGSGELGLLEGRRSNRRWHSSSALKFKGLPWQPTLPTRGLGKSDRGTNRVYWNSLRSTETKVFKTSDLWPEHA
jgi:hypothetical protein